VRYAHGVLIGFILSGVIFIGGAMIRLAGFGINDPDTLAALWSVYVLWVVISIILIFIPVIVGFFVYRHQIKRIVIFEAGSLAFFTPFWFALATELSGASFIAILLNGIENGLVFFDASGALVGVNVSPILLDPVFLFMIIIGIILLRPGFIQDQSTPSHKEPPELVALSEPDPIEAEMPEIAPPVADESSIDELRNLRNKFLHSLWSIDIDREYIYFNMIPPKDACNSLELTKRQRAVPGC